MTYDFSAQGFKDLLIRSAKEIYKRTNQGIGETTQFQQFLLSLRSCIARRATRDFKVLIIKESCFSDLTSDICDRLDRVLDSDDFIQNNYVEFNSNLDIVMKMNEHLYSSSEDARSVYCELSKKGYVVFLLQSEGKVCYFINGDICGDEVIFYTSDALNSFEERKSIDQICGVFNEYRVHLQNRNNYSKFFVQKSHLHVLHKSLKSVQAESQFVSENKHLLRNKPEDSFREDLRFYLQAKLKNIIIPKEYVLNNFDRLDILLIDDLGSELYLIEVKWVGRSINPNGDKFGTKYDEKDINPDAIIQTVNYLKWLNEERKNVKIGYLVVFDARKDNLPDTGHEITPNIFNEEEKKHYRKFRKVPDFRVLNIHPN